MKNTSISHISQLRFNELLNLWCISFTTRVPLTFPPYHIVLKLHSNALSHRITITF